MTTCDFAGMEELRNQPDVETGKADAIKKEAAAENRLVLARAAA